MDDNNIINNNNNNNNNKNKNKNENFLNELNNIKGTIKITKKSEITSKTQEDSYFKLIYIDQLLNQTQGGNKPFLTNKYKQNYPIRTAILLKSYYNSNFNGHYVDGSKIKEGLKYSF